MSLSLTIDNVTSGESHNSWPCSINVGVFPLHDSKIKIRALILEYIERLTMRVHTHIQ